MANDIEENKPDENKKIDFEDLIGSFAKRFTPEYLSELAINSYNDDRAYPENFSNWYYNIKNFGEFAHANIVANQVLTFEEVEDMERTENIDQVNWDRLAEIFKPTLDAMKPNTYYSIKNGCFSNKFDFETCVATKDEFLKKMWQINYMSSMFETGGYTEVVVRDYIPCDLDHNLTIYNGMPLRTEVRVFYNIDTKEIEYAVDYWDYDYCAKNINKLNDRIIFDVFHNKTEIKTTDHNAEYERILKRIKDNINTLEFEGLTGIWSIDFMYDNNTGKTYLIDMARGFRSAYWDFRRLKSETREKLQAETEQKEE